MLNIDVNRSAKWGRTVLRLRTCRKRLLDERAWHMAGRGAERLGLRGPVQRSHFVALLRNENPTTGKRLTARTQAGRRTAKRSATGRLAMDSCSEFQSR